jgi:hypothetical protein
MKTAAFRKFGLLLVAILICQGCTYKLLFWECNIWQEFEGIFVIEEPVNLDVYRQLLPEQFGLPETPLVGIFTVDYIDTEHWPITPTKYLTPYLESAVFLLCDYNGTEGWYCSYMAVTTEAALIGGHRLGFPKIVADSINFRQTDQGWVGSTMFENKEHIRLDMKEESRTALTGHTSMQHDFINGNRISDLTDTTILLKPPAVGPEVSIFSCSPPPLVIRRAGLVTINLSEPYADLITPGTVAPGLYQYFSLGDGQGPSGPTIALVLLIILLSGITLLVVWFLRWLKRRKLHAR